MAEAVRERKSKSTKTKKPRLEESEEPRENISSESTLLPQTGAEAKEGEQKTEESATKKEETKTDPPKTEEESPIEKVKPTAVPETSGHESTPEELLTELQEFLTKRQELRTELLTELQELRTELQLRIELQELRTESAQKDEPNAEPENTGEESATGKEETTDGPSKTGIESVTGKEETRNEPPKSEGETNTENQESASTEESTANQEESLAKEKSETDKAKPGPSCTGEEAVWHIRESDSQQEEIKSQPVKELHRFKVLVLGPPGVGKTSLVMRYARGIWEPSECYSRALEYEDCRIQLDLYDVGGQDINVIRTSPLYKNATGAFVLYDLLQPSTFDAALRWANEVAANCIHPTGQHIPCVLLANKCDKLKPGNHSDHKDRDIVMQFLEVRIIKALSITTLDATLVDIAFDYLVIKMKQNYINIKLRMMLNQMRTFLNSLNPKERKYVKAGNNIMNEILVVLSRD